MLLAVVVVDALWTTLWVDGGAGPVASRLSTWAWRGTRSLLDHHRRALSLFGPVLVVLAILCWITLLWTGWVLLFASDPGSLLSTRDYRTPAGWAGRVYFVGYSLTTMGNGDYTPSGGTWQVAAALCALSGLFLLTLVISYLLSLVGAVVRSRAFASEVRGLGSTAEEVLLRAWNGHDFRSLDLTLSSLSAQLAVLTEQNLFYPVLHHFHSTDPRKSVALSLAILDEALTILCHGVPRARRPSAPVTRSVRQGVRSYLGVLEAFIDPAGDPPPAPDLERLRREGIPVASDPYFARALDRISDRRRRLLGVVRKNAWDWPGTDSVP